MHGTAGQQADGAPEVVAEPAAPAPAPAHVTSRSCDLKSRNSRNWPSSRWLYRIFHCRLEERAGDNGVSSWRVGRVDM